MCIPIYIISLYYILNNLGLRPFYFWKTKNYVEIFKIEVKNIVSISYVLPQASIISRNIKHPPLPTLPGKFLSTGRSLNSSRDPAGSLTEMKPSCRDDGPRDAGQTRWEEPAGRWARTGHCSVQVTLILTVVKTGTIYA